MITFKDFLNEHYHNLFTPEEIAPHADALHHMVTTAYADIGGIKGRGFSTPEEIKHLPLVKMKTVDGVPKAAVFYKDKDGRKSVATGHDGTPEGKIHAKKMMGDELRFDRSYSEMSKAALALAKRHQGGDISHRASTYDEVKARLGDKEEIRKPPEGDEEMVRHPELVDHLYQRKLGDEWKTKIMIGAPGKPIKKQ